MFWLRIAVTVLNVFAGIAWYYENLGRALLRTVLAVYRPWKLPKRLDQLIFAFFGGSYKDTISSWAGFYARMLFTRPIKWFTEPFDRNHIEEAAREPHPAPGFRYFPIGLITLACVLKVMI